jgi:hypothetical protein
MGPDGQYFAAAYGHGLDSLGPVFVHSDAGVDHAVIEDDFGSGAERFGGWVRALGGGSLSGTDGAERRGSQGCGKHCEGGTHARSLADEVLLLSCPFGHGKRKEQHAFEADFAVLGGVPLRLRMGSAAFAASPHRQSRDTEREGNIGVG